MLRKLFIATVAVLFAISVQAQQQVNIRAPRPKVGVVLGGGGAKGAAHIGVLKYLEELGIPVDYVAGTSMGSIMAGLYAMGYEPNELAELIANINWSEYIGNQMDRSVLSYEMRKRRETTLFSVPFSLKSIMNRQSNGSLMNELPSAYVNNSSLINLFNDLCVGYQEDMDFNDLPIPFACVATDLVTGEEVVLRRGNVSTAMRASMAIPGVFSPVVVNDMVLVDGGLVNNFPADVLRKMGADIIIGVEITKDKRFTADDLRSLPQLMSRLLTNTTSAKRSENRDLCDVYIVPDVSGYGMLSFTSEAIDTLVNRGYRKAQEFETQLLALKRYVDTKAGYAVQKTLNAPRAKNFENDSILIRSIEVDGVSAQQNRWMIRKGRLEPGQYYSKNDIERAVNLYRGTGAFDEITYTIKESDSVHLKNSGLLSDMYDLRINMKPASPHVFGVGLHYDSDEGTGLLFGLGLNEKKFGGSKLNASVKLSYSPKINLTYTYSRSSLANFNLAFDYKDDNYKFWVSEEKNINMRFSQKKFTASISQFHLLNFSTSAGLSYLMTNYGGTGIDDNLFDVYFYTPSRHFVPYVEMEYDNLDDAYFANHGLYAHLASHYYMDPKNRNQDVFDACYAFKYYYSIKNSDFTLIPQVYGRYASFGMYPFLWNYYGGQVAGRHFDVQLPFVGSDPLREASDHFAVLRLDMRYRFYEKHYLTGMYNIAFNWNGLADHENGVGLMYSYNSFIGPISLMAQWGEISKKVSGYLSIGYYF